MGHRTMPKSPVASLYGRACGAALAGALLTGLAFPAAAFEITLNPTDTDGVTSNLQEFEDGQILSGYSVWSAAPDPFNTTSGFDGPAPSSWEFGQNFDVTVSFSEVGEANGPGYPEPGTSGDPGFRIRSAILELGLYDTDGNAAGSQVTNFAVNDSVDMTAAADAAVEAGEGVNRQYNVIQIALAGEALSDLFVEGMAVFRLQLGGTALGGPDNDNFPIEGGNFAGLDFAKLILDAVELPEPTTGALLGLALLALGARRRRA